MAQTRWVGDCLIFTGYRNTAGYGEISTAHKGGKQRAHRIVLEHHFGPSTLYALHSCHNPSCVNIDHLRWGSAQDNVHDMLTKLGFPLPPEDRICTVEGCTRPVNARAMCAAHYSRFQKGLPLEAPIGTLRKPRPLCTVDGCDRLNTAKGLCAVHYGIERRANGLR